MQSNSSEKKLKAVKRLNQVPKPKHWKYDTRTVSGKSADHIFDVDDEDDTLIQVT